jgi:hypothetical protein
MGDAYSYVIELVDKLTAPARALKSTVGDLIDRFRKGSEGADELGDAVDDAGKDAKDAKSGFDTLKDTLSALGPYAKAAAAAFAAVSAALLGGAFLSIKANEFKRSTLAALEATTGTAEAASETFKIIRNASDEIGYSEEKAQALGLSLLDAGLARDSLAGTLKAIALVEKSRGEEAGKKLADLVKKSAAAGTFKFDEGALEGSGLSKTKLLDALAKRTKTSVAAVEAQLKAGAISAADGMGAIEDALAAGGGKGITKASDAAGKLLEKVTRLFEDVDVSGFVEMIDEISELFEDSTVSGEALKFLVESVFTGFFAVAKEAFPYVKIAFYEVIILALRLYIAAKPIVAKVKELWASASEGDVLVTIIKSIVGVVVVAAVVVGVLLGAIIALNVGATMAFYWIATKASEAGTAIAQAFSAAWEWIKGIFSMPAAQGIASALIDGLVAGITGGASRVVQALAGVGTAAIGGVKSVLGIASPSKVMAEMGGHTAEGFALGVEEGTPDARGALEAAVAPPRAAAPLGSGGGAASVTVGQVVIQVGNASTAAELAELIPAKLVDALEALAMQWGAPATGGAT